MHFIISLVNNVAISQEACAKFGWNLPSGSEQKTKMWIFLP